MRKNQSIILILMLLFSFCSCGIALTNFRHANRQNILKLEIGMTKQETTKIMTARKISWPLLKISNPYKLEILKGKDKIFEVLYYYTDKKRADDVISDDELTPLIFDDGILIGWGNLFLSETVAKYEIRIR